jgi:ABC-2 type transport system permease protein
MAEAKYHPVWELFVTRVRLFLREPAAIFWVYGFPILMLVTLGVAFRDNPQENIAVDVVGAPENSPVLSSLQNDRRFKVVTNPKEDWKKRLQYGKTDLVVEVTPEAGERGYRYWEEPRRAESRLAHYAVDAVLGKKESLNTAQTKQLETAGSRYIDFLLPGMIGMGLMGGGLWGIGFVVVDMRVRKLLKRFLATPMRRSDFLLSFVFSRILFTLIDVVVLLLVGYFLFGTRCTGGYLNFSIVSLIGASSFAAIGLLVASRAETLETVSGLMNLIMLPMWVLSGVFFSSERFPEAAQPFLNLLPLTALNQALRGIMLEGSSIITYWPQLLLLSAYAIIPFAIALKIFKWK